MHVEHTSIHHRLCQQSIICVETGSEWTKARILQIGYREGACEAMLVLNRGQPYWQSVNYT